MFQFRYSFSLSKTKTARRFGFPVKELPAPSYNISPGQEVPAIPDLQPARISLFTLGITRSQLENPDKTACLDIKTVQRLLFYRDLLANRRCLIPADGFYLWKQVARKRYVPYRIVMKWNLPFAFAGLWHERIDETSGEIYRSCSLLTSPVNELLASLSPLMPAVLSVEAESQWLSGDITPEAALALLKPYPADKMRMFPVSARINDKASNDPELTQPVPEATDQLGNYVLFS